MITGAHESVAGGLHTAFARATADRCQALQIFTKNGSQWKEPVLDESAVLAFKAAAEAAGKPPVLAHASYLINVGAKDPELVLRSKDALVNEILRSSRLGVDFVVLHPGAHLGDGEKEGLRRVIGLLDAVLDATEGQSARLLIENTAGQGTCLGCRFEEVATILTGVEKKGRMGVCFDTQHAYASGYDLSTEQGFEKTWREFDSIVGRGELRAFHLNDSKKPLGSRVDRHEHVGEGNLGLSTFWRLQNDSRFEKIPGVVETEPAEGAFPYRKEVALLRGLAGKPMPKPKRRAFALELSPNPKARPAKAR